MVSSAPSSGLLAQLPRFSKFDPGAEGEGSLDPLGLSAIADRLAERLAPGVRARMRQPRFVTVAAVGALACSDLPAVDGTAYDIAFEWLVVEALVRRRDGTDLVGLPGARKVRRAGALGDRVHKGNYLNGPRVFGFTGVYRPFAAYADVLVNGEAHVAAENLVAAWEQDTGFTGFVVGDSRTDGGKLRDDIRSAVRSSLDAGEASAPPTGKLMRALSDHMGPLDAGAAEKRVLRKLITDSPSEIRNQVVYRLLQLDDWSGMHDPQLAAAVLDGAGPDLSAELQAIIDYEAATTAIDDAFRGLLAFGTAQGGQFTDEQAATTEVITVLAPRVRDLVERASDSVGELPQTLGAANLDRDALAADTRRALRHFAEAQTPLALVRALIGTHKDVQANKGKRMWIDPVGDRWVVRGAYGDQATSRTDDTWVHPMRLVTLANFLTETEAS